MAEHLKYGRKGQISLFDAILFLIIITIASAVLIVGIQKSQSREGDRGESEIGDYSENALAALLSSTLYETWYDDDSGERFLLRNRTVPYLLLFDIEARRKGSADNSSLKEGIENRVNELTGNLVSDRYNYILKVRHGDIELDLRSEHISIRYEPEEFFTSSTRIGGSGQLSGEATFELKLWSV